MRNLVDTDRKKVIIQFIDFLNDCDADYVIKGGLALIALYGLDREPTEIELDSVYLDLVHCVAMFSKLRGYSYDVVEDCDCEQRCIVT
jgi:hypothetical protein